MQMPAPHMQPPLQMPPQSLSPFPFQQNFTAPPLLPPLSHYQQQQQQFAPPEFLPQVQVPPSPQYSRSPTPTNQAARPLTSLSSQLLGQISQQEQPKKQKQSRQMTNGSRDPSKPPILPPLTTKRKEGKGTRMTMVVPPPPTAALSQNIWDPLASSNLLQCSSLQLRFPHSRVQPAQSIARQLSA